MDHNRLQETGYQLASLAKRVTDFQIDQGYIQMVEEPTRQQLINGEIKRSLLDVIYGNKEEKILGIHQNVVGRSDH